MENRFMNKSNNIANSFSFLAIAKSYPLTCCMSYIIEDAYWAVVELAILPLVTGEIKVIVMVTGGSRTIMTDIIMVSR
jgi:hypothetical protein